MYESPIEIIYTGMEQQFENNILKAIQHYEIQINKNELIKALNYDRNQYEKGYNDAMANLQKTPVNEKPKKGKWIYFTIRGEKRPCCSECGEGTGTIYEYRFCPNCGIEMTEDKT